MTADTTARNRAIVERYEAGDGMGRIAHEHHLAAATIRKIIGREQLAHIATGRPLTQMAYDGLVERWNGLTQSERQAAAAECRREGHDYREVPGGWAHVCRRCLNYARNERRTTQ